MNQVAQISNLYQETLKVLRSFTVVSQYIMKDVPSLEVHNNNILAITTEGRHTHGAVQINTYRVKTISRIWGIA